MIGIRFPTPERWRSILYYLLLSLLSISVAFPFSAKPLSASSNIEAAVLGVDTSGMVGDRVKVYILVKPYYAVVDRLTVKLSRVDYSGERHLEASKSYPGYVVRALATFHDVLTMTAPSRPGVYTYVLEVFYTSGGKTIKSSQVYFKLTFKGGGTTEKKTSTQSPTSTERGGETHGSGNATNTLPQVITVTHTVERVQVETKTVPVTETEKVTVTSTVTEEKEIESYGGFLGGLPLGFVVGALVVGSLSILLRRRG